MGEREIAEYALPEITDAVLDQWYESAKADADAGNPWSTNPLAIMAVVDELRRRRKERRFGMSGYCWSRHHSQCSGEKCGCRCHVDNVEIAEAGREWAGAPDGD